MYKVLILDDAKDEMDSVRHVHVWPNGNISFTGPDDEYTSVSVYLTADEMRRVVAFWQQTQTTNN